MITKILSKIKVGAAVFLCLFVASECHNYNGDISNEIYPLALIPPNHFPWIAILEYRRRTAKDKEFGCAGSLITKRYVLTAAHCLFGEIEWTAGTLAGVRLGVHSLDNYEYCQHDEDTNCGLLLEYENVTIHESYNELALTPDFDIGLIRLTQDVESNIIRPICFSQLVSIRKFQYFTVQGCGLSSKNTKPITEKLPHEIRKVDKILNFYGRNQILNLGDSCQDDSGGPLIQRARNGWSLAGILSSGPMCGNNLPATYTSVSAYLAWIENITKHTINDCYNK